jgi:hypothetical protein
MFLILLELSSQKYFFNLKIIIMKPIVFLLAFLLAIFGLTSFTTIEKPITQDICMTVDGINLDFTLVNKTGYDISDIYVGPSTQKEWGDDIMGQDVVLDGESVDVTFSADETDKKWDIYVTWVGYKSDEDVFWVGFDLSTISEITLYYDESTGKTWAVTK